MSIDHVTTLDAATFEARFLRPRRPVVWKGGLASSTPVQTWTMASLRDRCGDVTLSMADAEGDSDDVVLGAHIDALLAREASPSPSTTPAPRYLRNVFLRQALPVLFDEVEIPFFAEGNLLSQPFLHDAIPVEWTRWVEFFVSGRGTRFPRIHADTHLTHAWILQVAGEKRVWLWPPRRRTQKARIEDSVITVDVDDDTDLDHAMGHAPPLTGVVGPGDVLFIPAGWWHTVEALSLSITLSGNFVVEENVEDFVAFSQRVVDHGDAFPDPRFVEVARQILAAFAARDVAR